MLLLAIVAVTTLAANSARQLRYTAVAFFAVALAAHLIDDGTLAAAQVVVSAAAALVASAILFVAARDRRFGEDPGWRLWIATIVAAATTAAAFAFSARTRAALRPMSRRSGSCRRASPSC